MDEKLKTWQYYYDKLPLYFKNDDRIEEHFHCVFDLLVQLDLVEADILKGFDVMADDYLEFINSFDDSVEKDKSAMLEIIGQIYGVTRDFDLTIDGVIKPLHLNNEELLMLIKARIIQMAYDGTYKMAKRFYESVNIPVSIYYRNSAEATVFLDTSIYDLTTNVIDMFDAGLFTIKSMGIVYESAVIDSSKLAIWDSVEENRLWDVGLWL